MEEYAFWSRACILVYAYFGSLFACTLCIHYTCAVKCTKKELQVKFYEL